MATIKAGWWIKVASVWKTETGESVWFGVRRDTEKEMQEDIKKLSPYREIKVIGYKPSYKIK